MNENVINSLFCFDPIWKNHLCSRFACKKLIGFAHLFFTRKPRTLVKYFSVDQNNQIISRILFWCFFS